MKTVKLKNGSEELEALVITIMRILQSLHQQQPIALYEAVMVARDPTHKPWGNTGKVLKKYTLLGADGRMHGSIRNIVLSGVAGEEMEMRIVNPLAAEGAAVAK